MLIVRIFIVLTQEQVDSEGFRIEWWKSSATSSSPIIFDVIWNNCNNDGLIFSISSEKRFFDCATAKHYTSNLDFRSLSFLS